MKKLFLVCMAVLFWACSAQAAIATFDDLALSPESYQNGEDLSGYGSFGGFTSSGHYFANYKSDYPGWKYWDGFAYSNTTDTVTVGVDNQFSAVTGGGINGSSNYAVAYTLGMSGQKPRAFIGGDGGQAGTVSGTYVTNTTWGYQSMLTGDSIAKKFGGESGTDEDWFKLTFYGLDSTGERTGSAVDFFLADFRFADSGDDYILDEWSWVDLSGLGTVCGVEFILSSSDDSGGYYGMNTPAYFAMDNFDASPVPVPAAIWLLGSGIAGLACFKKKRA